MERKTRGLRRHGLPDLLHFKHRAQLKQTYQRKTLILVENVTNRGSNVDIPNLKIAFNAVLL